MAGDVKGKHIATGADGVGTVNLVDGVLSADAAGRAKMAANLFDAGTVAAKFTAGAIQLDRLVEAVIQADGGQAFTAAQSMGGFELTNLGTPTAGGSAANRNYVDATALGLQPKAAVRVTTFQRVGLDGTAPVYNNTGGTSGRGQITWTTGPTAIDGITLANGDRMLLKNEQDGGGLGGAANGIWVRTGANTWDRAADFDADAEVKAGAFAPTEEGTTNGDKLFLLTTNNPIVIGGAGGTSLVFSSFGELQLGGVAPTTIQPDDAAAEGTATRAARTDHRHAIVAATPGTTVKSEATAAAEGAATSFMRSDAQVQAATATPGTTVKSEATAASQGAASTLLRSDAQIQAATATVVDVGTANAQGSSSSLARADHVHRSPKPTTADKARAPSATAGSNYTTAGLTISATPALGGHVRVVLNKLDYNVGDGNRDDLGSFTNNVEFYFSGDGGTTARAMSAIVSGDTLYFNPVHAGFDLTTADEVSLHYEIF